MNNQKLVGGVAVGTGLVVWITHGKDFTPEEITAMAAGLGAGINYLVQLAERLLLGEKAAEELKL